MSDRNDLELVPDEVLMLADLEKSGLGDLMKLDLLTAASEAYGGFSKQVAELKGLVQSRLGIGYTKRPRMTVDAANEKAMMLARRMGRHFFELPRRRQAKKIGCAYDTWKKTRFYQVAQSKRPPKLRRPVSPRAESLAGAREAVTGEGERDETLLQLIADHEKDKEPSPLDAAPTGRRRRVHSGKRL